MARVDAPEATLTPSNAINIALLAIKKYLRITLYLFTFIYCKGYERTKVITSTESSIFHLKYEV